jgi:hypothetical protein
MPFVGKACDRGKYVPKEKEQKACILIDSISLFGTVDLKSAVYKCFNDGHNLLT